MVIGRSLFINGYARGGLARSLGVWIYEYIHYIFTSEIRMSKDNKLSNMTRWQESLIINHNTAGNPLASFASFGFGLLVA